MPTPPTPRSVKAIYTGELGWFDGQAEDLYPMPYDEESTKTLLLMGGASKVLKAVEDAQAMNDHRWALHLIKIIRGSQAKDKSGGLPPAANGWMDGWTDGRWVDGRRTPFPSYPLTIPLLFRPPFQ